MNNRVRKIKKRLYSFEITFYKHAEICSFCHSLNVWSMGEAMPEQCHRCKTDLPKA